MNTDRVVSVEFDNGVEIVFRDDLNGWIVTADRGEDDPETSTWDWWDGEGWQGPSFTPKAWPFDEAQAIALALPRQAHADDYEDE